MSSNANKMVPNYKKDGMERAAGKARNIEID